MKPDTCVDAKCQGNDHCSGCINRSIIAKEGYSLLQTIERIPASEEQTNAVIEAERFIKLAENAATSTLPKGDSTDC